MRRTLSLVAPLIALLAASCGTRGVELAEPADVAEPSAVSSTSSSTTTTVEPVTTTTASTTTTSTTSSTTTTTTTTPPTELVLDDEGVPANGQTSGVVITPTGWVVPVLGETATGWRVWTPCGRVADVGSGTHVDSADFVLDPGHGGSEPGAVGPGGTREADLNLQVTNRIKDVLEADGYSVVMTRTADVRVPIVTRAEIAHALAPRAFLSIHHNAGTDAPSSAPGTEMWHQIDNPESRRLAGLLYEEVRAVLDQYDADWVSMSDAGAMSRPNRSGGDYYGVLRRPDPHTAVLLEFAYVANASEEALLNRADVQDGLARSVGKAVERLFTTEDPGSGYTEDPIFRGYGPSGAGRTTNCTDPVLE